jgi:uncharacterized membrane protein
MALHPDKVLAVLARLGGKSRVRRGGAHRPVAWRGQFSLAALVILTTAASIASAVWHYRGIEILDHVAERNRVGAQAFPESLAGDFVPIVVLFASVLLAIAAGCLVFHLRPDRGLSIVWTLACLAVLGLVIAWCLPVAPLAETKLKHLQVEQITAACLFGLCSLLPLGAAAGWYARFATEA